MGDGVDPVDSARRSDRLSDRTTSRNLRVMLAGDLMLGRGVDQIFPDSAPPDIYEPYMTSALGYVALAEERNGPIPRPVGAAYVWGDARARLARRAVDLGIVNLETAVTCAGSPEVAKGIQYRMHPRNLSSLKSAPIDCCVLANNHVLDWGEAGLRDTLDALAQAGIAICGAGRNRAEAGRAAVLDGSGRRVLVYGLAFASSGVPAHWGAGPARPGVSLFSSFDAAAQALVAAVGRDRFPGDLVVASVHWGANWSYAIEAEESRFARRLIDEAGVDVVHGHSSHHFKGFEFHRGRPILYGCGDLINDYEGIGGHESFRPDLRLIYLLEVDGEGACRKLEILPFRQSRMRLENADHRDVDWLCATIGRVCRELGNSVALECRGDDEHGRTIRATPVG